MNSLPLFIVEGRPVQTRWCRMTDFVSQKNPTTEDFCPVQYTVYTSVSPSSYNASTFLYRARQAITGSRNTVLDFLYVTPPTGTAKGPQGRCCKKAPKTTPRLECLTLMHMSQDGSKQLPSLCFCGTLHACCTTSWFKCGVPPYILIDI